MALNQLLNKIFGISPKRQKEDRDLRFKLIGLELADEEMFWIDPMGQILDANRTACQKLGYTLEEMRQLSVKDVDAAFDFDLWDSHWADLKKHKVLRFESRHRHRNGNEFPTEIVANFFEFEGQEYNCALVRDITQRKDAEARIIRLGKLYRALSEVNQAIVRMEEEPQLFPLVCRMAVDFGDMTLAAVSRANDDFQYLRPIAVYGKNQGYMEGITLPLDSSLPEGNGPAAQAFRENRNVIVADYLHQDITRPWHERAARYGWNSSGSFPIQRGGKPYALLSVYHEHPEAFDKEVTNLLDEMARDVAFALDSFDRNRHRVEAEEALIARERHFRAYFERSMVGMAATGPDKRWIEVNDSLCDMLGYTRTELLSMTWENITHEDDLTNNMELFQRVLQGDLEEFVLDKRFIRKDGSVLMAHLAARSVRNPQGKVDYFVVILNDVTEMRNQQRQLEILVHHDPLTGIPNRLLFNDRLEMALAVAHRHGTKLAVCFMDLDGFKPVNDTFGHAVGDLLLINVAKRMQAISRSSDTVARLGGDEFALILADISDKQECLQMLSRIMETIALPFSLDGREILISTSIGVTLYPDDQADGENLLRHADQAMYLAKQSGRNRVHFFDPISDRVVQTRSENLSHVEMALMRQEFLLHYQPKVHMRSGKVIGMEALIRWQHPERGLLPPSEFLPLVENSTFEVTLSRWVIETAMAQLCLWQAAGLILEVSINLPARHLQQDDFPDFMSDLLKKYLPVRPEWVNLEILETAAIGDMNAVIRKIEACMALGLRFSIDDFGTGYASLAYLRRLPADTIKIDRSFVIDMLHDADDLSIVKGVIGLARTFHKSLVAEGVETVAHGALLLELGCEAGQGYGIARPMAPELVATWIAQFCVPDVWREAGAYSPG